LVQQTVIVVVVSGVTLPWAVAVPVGLQVPEGEPVIVLLIQPIWPAESVLHRPIGSIGMPPSAQSELCVPNQAALPWIWHEVFVGGSQAQVPTPQLRPSCALV
jgi:hypothetical protein